MWTPPIGLRPATLKEGCERGYFSGSVSVGTVSISMYQAWFGGDIETPPDKWELQTSATRGVVIGGLDDLLLLLLWTGGPC